MGLSAILRLSVNLQTGLNSANKQVESLRKEKQVAEGREQQLAQEMLALKEQVQQLAQDRERRQAQQVKEGAVQKENRQLINSERELNEKVVALTLDNQLQHDNVNSLTAQSSKDQLRLTKLEAKATQDKTTISKQLQEVKDLQRANQNDERYKWAMQQNAKLQKELQVLRPHNAKKGNKLALSRTHVKSKPSQFEPFNRQRTSSTGYSLSLPPCPPAPHLFIHADLLNASRFFFNASRPNRSLCRSQPYYHTAATAAYPTEGLPNATTEHVPNLLSRPAYKEAAVQSTYHGLRTRPNDERSCST